MNIAIIGSGYVGLVTGACFAGSGNNVICVDVDESKIQNLEAGVVPFYEPGLEELVHKNFKEGRIQFTTNLAEAIEKSFVVFIAVGTPPQSDGSADVGAVLSAARSIGKSLKSYKIVVTKSTVPVGTTERIHAAIKEVSGAEFDVASNPEFLKEGSAVEDFMKPERVVIGVDKASVGAVLKELYAPFMRSADRAMVVSIRSSELAKYTANAMLATRISFMNEIANLCELIGADVSEVRGIVGADGRIGRAFLYPGVGYGGSCFPKDVKALIKTARDLGYALKVSEATDSVNSHQRERFWDKIRQYFSGDLRGRKFGVWGLSFKPNTDDLREAPSLYVIDRLIEAGAEVIAHDPIAMPKAAELLGGRIKFAASNYDVCQGAEALLIHTEWSEYRQPDFDKMKEVMASPVIFDGRNLYDPKKLKTLGFKYFGVGIGN
ncbi:MAG: UDP-glucose dehydrogenase family protein [Deltaproteobacteria bacterium]